MNENAPGCLTAMLRLFGFDISEVTQSVEEPLPYRLRDDFLSPAELSFFRVLQKAVGDQFVLLAKVNLADLLFVTGQSRTSFQNKINRKHIDFLLCEPSSIRPVIAVELDDRSHQRSDRQQRDAFVDAAVGAAGLRLVRMPAGRGYSVEQLRSLFLADTSETTIVASSTISDEGIPTCPKCHTPMKRQTARRGAKAGKPFWGCPNYPKCRETSDIVD